MSNKELQRVSDAEKVQQHANLGSMETGKIAQELITGYEEKSLGNTDAQHDAKIIALKYTGKEYSNGRLASPDGVIDVQNFIQVRNDLGKDFYDNLLYKYNVPYNEITSLAEELRRADANRITEMKNDLVQLLENMGDPIVIEGVVKGNETQNSPSTEKFVGTNLSALALESRTAGQGRKNAEYFEGRQNKLASDIQTEFRIARKGTMCPAGAADRLSLGMMQWWYGKVDAYVQKYNADKAENAKATNLQVAEWMNLSPLKLTAAERAQFGVADMDMNQLVRNLQSARNFDTDTPITDLSQVPELMTISSLQTFLANKDNYVANASLCLTVDAKSSVSALKPEEMQTLTSGLQNMINSFESARTPTDTERMIGSVTPVLNKLGSGLEQAANYLTGFVDQLKASGVREKIEKLWDLLFGDGDFLDRLSKFNEMKESNLGIDKTAALTMGVNMCNEGDALKNLDKQRTKTGPLDNEEKDVVHSKLGVLFKADYLGKDRNSSPRCVELKKTLGAEVYAKMVGEGGDVYDMIAKNVLTAENYTSYLDYRNKGDSQSAFSILEHSGLGVVKDEVAKNHPNITSHELYLKVLLARMLGSKDNAAGIAKAATNETQKGIDAARVELDALTKDINMRIDGDKLYLDGVPTTDKVGIKIGSADPFDYNHADGVALSSLGTPPKFAVVKKVSDKRSDLVRTGDLSVIPSTNIEVGNDKKQVTVQGLEAGEYSFSTSYKNNATTSVVDTQATVSTKNAPLVHTFAADKGEPTVLKIKPKNGGLRQTIWKS